MTVTIEPGRKSSISYFILQFSFIGNVYALNTKFAYIVEGNFSNSTREVTQYTNLSDVSLVAQQTYMLLFTEEPVTKNELNRYVLPVLIGIICLIVIILTVTHLCMMFKERTRTIARQMKETISTEQDGVQLHLDSVYQDIDECL